MDLTMVDSLQRSVNGHSIITRLGSKVELERKKNDQSVHRFRRAITKKIEIKMSEMQNKHEREDGVSEFSDWLQPSPPNAPVFIARCKLQNPKPIKMTKIKKQVLQSSHPHQQEQEPRVDG